MSYHLVGGSNLSHSFYLFSYKCLVSFYFPNFPYKSIIYLPSCIIFSITVEGSILHHRILYLLHFALNLVLKKSVKREKNKKKRKIKKKHSSTAVWLHNFLMLQCCYRILVDSYAAVVGFQINIPPLFLVVILLKAGKVMGILYKKHSFYP